MNKIDRQSRKFDCIFLLFCVLVVFSGCNSNKHTSINTAGSVELKNDKQIIEDILKAQLNYKTLSGKVSIELSRQNVGSGTKANCYIKLIKDTELQLSLRIPIINSEAFRLNITPDSVYVLDRLNKSYAVENIKDYQQKYNIDLNFFNFESILTDALFIPGHKSVAVKKSNLFSIAMVGGHYYLETRDGNNTKYSFAVNAKDRVESTMIYNRDYNFNIECLYSNFVQNRDSQIYPTNIITKIGVDDYKMSFNIIYSGLDLDSDIRIDRQIPAKYQKKSVTAILRNYIK